MNKLIKFSNDDLDINNLTSIIMDNEPIFLCQEVGMMLEYSHLTNSLINSAGMLEGIDYKKIDGPKLSQLKEILQMSNTHLQISEMQRSLIVLTESGFNALLLKSTKEKAVKIRIWVTNEVLPNIRKHGMYATPQTINQMLNNPDFLIETLQELKKERAEKQKAIDTKAEIGSRREATAMNTASQAAKKVKKLTEELGMNQEWATILKVSIVLECSEKKFNWRKLKKTSFEIGKPPKRIKDPRFGYANSYCSEAWYMAYDVMLNELF